MHVIYADQHHHHQPRLELASGQATDHQEVPARVDRILRALATTDWAVNPVAAQPPAQWLSEVHEADYLQYLTDTQNLAEAEVVYPSVWPFQANQITTSRFALAGQFCFDMFTPIDRNTYSAAIDSARCAWEAAEVVRLGQQRVVYSLGRPPGHHAEPGKAGGYCYLNNCAVAAQHLSQFGRVATLDVDFHHGNGTQHIFYTRSDVLTVSIHADPNWKFPYFSGAETEAGAGQGTGFNLNLCLGEGTTDQQYDQVLTRALDRIAEFRPDYLVVSFGADTHVSDPIGGFRLSTEYFTHLGHQIASLELPSVIVQEGGYNTDKLGTNVVAFLHGFNT